LKPLLKDNFPGQSSVSPRLVGRGPIEAPSRPFPALRRPTAGKNGVTAAARFPIREEFTVADILMVTVLRQARRAGVLAKFPRCEAYRQKCEARPAWGRTVAAYEKRLDAEPGAVARVVELP